MPAILIESCNEITSILKAMDSSSSHNWLISYLDCLDTENSDGCDKWNNCSLILTDAELKKDIYSGDMSFMWGVFSAIPKEHSQDEIYSYKLPELEIPDYMANRIVPQHPLAFLEISIWDGSYTYVSAHDENILKQFHSLPYKVIDAEADNRAMNEKLCRIQDMLRGIIPDVTDEAANEIQWSCWHSLFRDNNSDVSDKELEREIKKAYEKVSSAEYHSYRTFWDPYAQK